jgi:hypothetical protein
MYTANIQDFFGAPVLPGSQSGMVATGLKIGLKVAPNPFRGSSVVTYSLPKTGAVSVRLYDVTGRMEVELYSGRQRAGSYRLNLANPELAAGIYFLRMRFDDGAGEQRMTTKVLIER